MCCPVPGRGPSTPRQAFEHPAHGPERVAADTPQQFANRRVRRHPETIPGNLVDVFVRKAAQHEVRDRNNICGGGGQLLCHLWLR